MENSQAESGEFWTLTYANDPGKGDYYDFKKFYNRLRNANLRKGNPKQIRYLVVGEYGSKSGRFHFHALIWNNRHHPAPRQPREDWLTRLWPHGFAYIGTVTPESIRYTARYCLKFADKGKEAMARWSRKPPLGEPGARWLGQKLRSLGHTPPSAGEFNGLKIGGKTYVLDAFTRETILENWGVEVRDRHPLEAAIAHRVEMIFGDPVLREKQRIEDRNTFWETIQFVKEEI